MSFTSDFSRACEKEACRLNIAQKWADAHPSSQHREFCKGKDDRKAGKPCQSSNGNYLEGWYSV